jgi:hypothetical protein
VNFEAVSNDCLLGDAMSGEEERVEVADFEIKVSLVLKAADGNEFSVKVLLTALFVDVEEEEGEEEEKLETADLISSGNDVIVATSGNVCVITLLLLSFFIVSTSLFSCCC